MAVPDHCDWSGFMSPQRQTGGCVSPSQVLLSAARWRPGGHVQPTEPPLSTRQPNWHRMEKQAASPGRSSQKNNHHLHPQSLSDANGNSLPDDKSSDPKDGRGVALLPSI